MDDNHNYISDELLAAFLDGNVNEDEATQVIGALANNPELAQVFSLSAEIDKEMEREYCRIIPMRALAAANEENLCSFDCETFILQHLDFDIDHWSLLETAKANNWLREDGTPLHHVGRLLELKGMHVERKYDASINNLGDTLEQGKYVIAIVDKNRLEGNEDVASTTIPQYHAIYIEDVDKNDITYLNLETLKDEYISIEDFKKAWECSGNYMVAALSSDAGYNPQPIDVTDIDLDADLEELTEAIAENAHDTWARARMDEGWTYGPTRDDAKKQHPDLVPYAKLTDSEKEYDRIMAMNTLRLVRRLGFDITNNNKN